MRIPDQDPRGELVRPFSLTRGRAKPVSDIAMDAILETTVCGRQEAPFAGRHKHLIAQLCQHPQSLAEIAAHMSVPLGVAKVLVADMTTEQMLTLHQISSQDGPDDRLDIMERVLDGLRRL